MIPRRVELSRLNHYSSQIGEGNGRVYFLDRGSVINAEDEAMLQALHSRSVGGFESHLEKLGKASSGNFMEKFYVGYGHGSIGDCGDTTLFIEGVSMLAAKAIQDWPLYNGQEASTRYIDFSSRELIDPTESLDGNLILEGQRDFYLSILDPIKAALIERYPKSDKESKKVYANAINARAFDIARGFLPAGASTNLAWHSSIRQIRDRLPFLKNHPLEEVRQTAKSIEEVVVEKLPHSFSAPKFRNELEREKFEKKERENDEYQKLVSGHYYFDEPIEDFSVLVEANSEEIQRYRELFEQRPAKSELPKFLWDSARVACEFELDFGSFRDVQRHRAIRQRMPLLSFENGFGDWYLENLPKEEVNRAMDHLGNIERDVSRLGISKEDSQYFVPMGQKVPNKIAGDLDGMVYLVERRDRSDVHPTLQDVAGKIGDEMELALDIPLHRQKGNGRFDTRRGKQDIEERD